MDITKYVLLIIYFVIITKILMFIANFAGEYITKFFCDLWEEIKLRFSR